MIATRSLMLSASSWSWVTKRKVMPTSRWIALSSVCIACRSLRSSAASGSSSSSTLGSLISARPVRLAAVGRRRAGSAFPRPCRRARPAPASGDALVERGLVDALAAQAETDVAPYVEVLEEGVALEDRVDVALVRRSAGDVLPADQDRPCGRVAEAGDHPQRRGLAAPPRAQQREELAARDVEVEVVDHGRSAEDLRQAAQLDRRCAHWRSPPVIRSRLDVPRPNRRGSTRRPR